MELCRRYCAQQGWDVAVVFDGAAQSGSNTLLRPGYQRMVLAAETGAFDVVVCEAVDRLSRRLSDVAALHDRLALRGVAIHAVTLGVITMMHVGIIGMMTQRQIADLGAKTKRGQSGRGRAGRIPAGFAYGYAVVARSRVADLIDALADGDARSEASEALRSLINKIRHGAGRECAGPS